MNFSQQLNAYMELLGCPAARLEDEAERCERLRQWLMEEQPGRENVVSRFLNRVDEFDLNEYIRAIHFDEMKVPPAMLPAGGRCRCTPWTRMLWTAFCSGVSFRNRSGRRFWPTRRSSGNWRSRRWQRTPSSRKCRC